MSATHDASDRGWWLLFGAWLMAASGTLGSLFFSEVMDLPPCLLCWYQRIFLYPLVVVLMVGLFPLDRGVVRYGLPLAGGGWLIALYHSLLHLGVLPESAAPCSQGVSCTEKYLNLFGFVSIPVLSWLAFSAILALLFTLRRIRLP